LQLPFFLLLFIFIDWVGGMQKQQLGMYCLLAFKKKKSVLLFFPKQKWPIAFEPPPFDILVVAEGHQQGKHCTGYRWSWLARRTMEWLCLPVCMCAWITVSGLAVGYSQPPEKENGHRPNDPP
jgi:hypothetical protein